jgi:DNA-binding NtrC family response regulator
MEIHPLRHCFLQEGFLSIVRVCVISEDRALQSLLSSTLGSDFYVPRIAGEADMDDAVASADCDVVILDLDSHHDLVYERVQSARRLVGSQPPWIIMADDALRTTADELIGLGAYGYCRRPPSIRDLRIMLRRAHESSTLKTELQAVQRHLDEVGGCDRLVGASPQMRQVYHLVESVSDINVSVLITGQSGTGKELIARAIHNRGTRSNRPFVAVACGAIPETLIEAELFGHEKGAYTGTVGARAGYFEQAADGTVFLDEIGELSLTTQVKLLRVLQEREFSRLGSSRVIPLRARLIFATNQNLAEMVDQGKFRQDLFYRINVFRIETPPLQEHPEDIPQIAMHFLRVYSQMYEKPVDTIVPDALAMLQRYSWPGNVRELENVIQRAIVFAGERAIRAADLPPSFQAENVVEIDSGLAACSFERQIHEFKLKLAANAIRENKGNKTLAARSLGISRAYLHRLIRHNDPEVPGDDDDQSDFATERAHA